MQTIQQRRAKHALEQVRDIHQQHADKASKIKARAAELPFMIHTHGLGQATSFFKSKKDNDGYDIVYNALTKWLTDEGQVLAKHAQKGELLAAITQCDLHTYRVAQAEAMQYMEWFKKFAQAYLG